MAFVNGRCGTPTLCSKCAHAVNLTAAFLTNFLLAAMAGSHWSMPCSDSPKNAMPLGQATQLDGDGDGDDDDGSDKNDGLPALSSHIIAGTFRHWCKVAHTI